MEKLEKISFRLPKKLKSFLMDIAENAELSLTDICIWILESYEKGEDLTNSAAKERSEWQADIDELAIQLAESEEKTGEFKKLYQEQNLQIQQYQEKVKKAVNEAFLKGFATGEKQAQNKSKVTTLLKTA